MDSEVSKLLLSKIVVRNIEPIVLRTTLGLYGSTVSSANKIFWIPNQSAVRIIVPKLPGSLIPSSATIGPNEIWSKPTSGDDTIARTPGNVSVVLICPMSLRPQNSTWASCSSANLMSACISASSRIFPSMTTNNTSASLVSASCTPFTPSTINSCAAARCFFCCNSLICLMVAKVSI